MKIIWRACSVLKTWRNSMAKAGRLPDFRKMYPEASEEIISVLKETERKDAVSGIRSESRTGGT